VANQQQFGMNAHTQQQKAVFFMRMLVIEELNLASTFTAASINISITRYLAFVAPGLPKSHRDHLKVQQ